MTVTEQSDARDLFPESHPSYQDEKARTWGQSPTRMIGLLDAENFARLVEIALAKYGEQAAQYAALAGRVS